MAGYTDVKSIVAGLQSDEPQARKLAAFNLQGALSKDVSFAGSFSQAGGLPILRRLILDERGNTLAYALGSFTQLLQQDFGWGQVEKSIVSLALDLIVGRSVINVLRNALSLLVLVVTQAPPDKPLDLTVSMPPESHSFDYGSLKTTLKDHPTFLESLAERLSSADHALCANVLRLINGLLRDSIENGDEDEWPVYYKQLQDLGVLVAVEQIMRGDAVADLFDHLVEFQYLVKALLKRWRAAPVKMDITMHRTALLAVHHSSFPPSPSPRRRPSSALNMMLEAEEEAANDDQMTWRRLGFTTEKPAHDFDDLSLLGLVDLTEYARDSNDDFEKELLEQSVQPTEERCPIARVSLAITRMLYDFFHVDNPNEIELARGDGDRLALIENLMQPNMMRWHAIHMAAVNLFIRLWTSARAVTDEFEKISGLVNTLLVDTLKDTTRRDTTDTVLELLNNATLAQVRDMQAKFLEATSLAAWGNDLEQLRQRLHEEAIRFMQEQRIRCLLAGAWFPVVVGSVQIPASAQTPPPSSRSSPAPVLKPDAPAARTRVTVHSWRFVRLSAGRRHLHHSMYASRPVADPETTEMRNRIDVTSVKSVVSNVSMVDWADPAPGTTAAGGDPLGPPGDSAGAGAGAGPAPSGSVLTSLQIVGVPKRTKDAPGLGSGPGSGAGAGGAQAETTLLELHTATPSLASEWLDGLLMLLSQKPITADTDRMIRLIAGWSLKARVMNLDGRDAEARRLKGGDAIAVPSREGVGTDFHYRMGNEA